MVRESRAEYGQVPHGRLIGKLTHLLWKWLESQAQPRGAVRAFVARRLSQVSVHQLFDELDALEFHQLRVAVVPSIERQLNLPGARKHLGILDRDLVVDHVRTDRREPLHEAERLAVEIAGAVEPGLIVEAA